MEKLDINIEFVAGLSSVALGIILPFLGQRSQIKNDIFLNTSSLNALSIGINALSGGLIGAGALLMVDPAKVDWKEKIYKGVIVGGLVGGLHAH